jgi:hypothetical protein
MSATLIPIIVTITKNPAANTPTGAAFASTSVVVMDSSGVAQTPVLLTGKEATPWSFTTSVNPGAGSVVATDLDVNGAVLGTPVSQSFTEAGTPPTFLPTSGIVVTPVGTTASTAVKK